MTEKQMTAAQFSDLVSAYGGEATRWPEAQRDAMRAFSENHAEAQAMRGREASLDSWLTRRLEPAPPALTARIEADMVEALAMRRQTTVSDVIFAYQDGIQVISRRHYASGMAAAAACLMIGFVMAPQLLELVIGSPDIIASLGVFSDELLLN